MIHHGFRADPLVSLFVGRLGNGGNGAAPKLVC
jgi:hypothetical protein